MTNRVKTVKINRGNKAILGDYGVTIDVMDDNNRVAGSAIDGVLQHQDLAK